MVVGRWLLVGGHSPSTNNCRPPTVKVAVTVTFSGRELLCLNDMEQGQNGWIRKAVRVVGGLVTVLTIGSLLGRLHWMLDVLSLFHCLGEGLHHVSASVGVRQFIDPAARQEGKYRVACDFHGLVTDTICR